MSTDAQWTDFDETSVLNLDGSDATVDPHRHPRLVVAREEDGSWRGFAVVAGDQLLEFEQRVPSRDEAKKALGSSILRSLHEDAARKGHEVLLTFQPTLERLAG